MPKMSFSYSCTPKDLATIKAMRENSIRTASRIGTLTEEPALAVGRSSLHYQGTVRMGATDDGRSVCDPCLRVWGIDNLYVGGNGVIPTATVANPTLTMVALTWRAARQLAWELDSVANNRVTTS
jgi:choline dehydrogenase-like flavoprotein